MTEAEMDNMGLIAAEREPADYNANFNKLCMDGLNSFIKQYPSINSGDMQTYIIAFRDGYNEAIYSMRPTGTDPSDLAREQEDMEYYADAVGN